MKTKIVKGLYHANVLNSLMRNCDSGVLQRLSIKLPMLFFFLVNNDNSESSLVFKIKLLVFNNQSMGETTLIKTTNNNYFL
jgi:hypothetical protein